MKTFAALYRRLDAATSTNHKNQALQDYLRVAVTDPRLHASAAWTVYFLAGGGSSSASVSARSPTF